MSTEVQTCRCSPLGATDVVWLCEEHHRYWKGGKGELMSVTRIIRETWPIAKDYEKADPAVLEHARERGVRVDGYVNQFVSTGTLRIPAGEWREVVELVQKFVKWYSPTSTPVHSQVMLHDDTVAGTADLLDGSMIWDLKCTYNMETTYEIQLGAYADLYESQFGKPPEGIGIIHLTKRYATPKVIPLDLKQCVADWRALRSVYEMVKRRTA